MITKTLNDYATELAMINANFCSTYSPNAIYEFTLETLRISICNRIEHNNIVKMEQKDIDRLDFRAAIHNMCILIYYTNKKISNYDA